MRYTEIMELAGVKRFKDMTATGLLDYIKANFGSGPVKVLGKGANGAVVQMGTSIYKFWMVDSAYTDFVHYCKKNQQNPFLPKFLSSIKRMPAFFVRHQDAPDYVNYIKIEKLEEANKSPTSYSFWIEAPNADGVQEEYEVTVQQIINIVNNTSLTWDPFHDFVAAVGKQVGINVTWDKLPHDLKAFVTALIDIVSLNHELDLHDENFMYRGEQLVIIDPIMNENDVALNTMFSDFDMTYTKPSPDSKPAMSSYVTQTKDDEDEE